MSDKGKQFTISILSILSVFFFIWSIYTGNVEEYTGIKRWIYTNNVKIYAASIVVFACTFLILNFATHFLLKGARGVKDGNFRNLRR